jgi:glutamate synthase (NADPH/NADH) small chain
MYAVSTQEFIGEAGVVTGLKLCDVELKNGKFEVVSGTERIIKADYVFLAMGFVGPEVSVFDKSGLLALDNKGNIARDSEFQTNLPGVFVCGDAGRGQSLIVWAIAEGRSCARNVDIFLAGSSQLPAPITPSDRPLVLQK